MRFPNKDTVERIRRDYPAGTRVELVRMDDAQAPLAGTLGTVLGLSLIHIYESPLQKGAYPDGADRRREGGLENLRQSKKIRANPRIKISEVRICAISRFMRTLRTPSSCKL